MTTEHRLDVAGLRQTVADLVEESPDAIGEEVNLFTLGLESIALMQLVGRWRSAGIEVNFAELAENPTISAWSKLMCAREPATATSTGVDGGTSAGAEFPLAVMQHAYWIGRQDGQPLGGVAAHLYTEFDGVGIDPDRLRTVIEQLITRHDMLRAHFTSEGKQQIRMTSGWRGLAVHDLRELDHEQSTAQLELIRGRLSHQMLDIQRGEVFSTALSLLPGKRNRLHLDVDMVAADAVSYRTMLADLAQLYEQLDTALPTIGYSYGAYRSACSGLRSEAARRAAIWWQGRLADLPGAPELPLAPGPGPGEREIPVRAARRYFTLSAQKYATLTAAAHRRGLTLAMVMATAFAEVVGAWCARPRFLLNVPLFDREPVHPDVHKLVGDFTGSVMLEVDVTEPVEFAERVRRMQARMHADAAQAAYSGVEVLRDLTRRGGEQVLAPVVFTSALSLGELFDPVVRRCFGDPVWIISQGPQVLLDAQIVEMDGGLLVNWDLREREFAEGVTEAMFTAFEQLVHRLAEDGTAWRAPVDGLLPAGQAAVRQRVNDTVTARSGRLLHGDFFAMSQRAPTAPALLWGEQGRMCYAELADRALRVAGALRARGVEPGDAVGVTLPRGPDQTVAILGVLAAGGVYVPVGVEQPALRRERMLRTAGVRVTVDEITMPAARCASPLDRPVVRSEDEPAYVIFTSGSTGAPKGVEVSHRAAMNTIDDINSRYRIGANDRVLAVSASDFDLSVYDIFGLLCVGGAVVGVGEDQRRDAAAWTGLVARHGVTIWNTVPQLLDVFLTAATSAEAMASLRVALVSGDRVGTDLSARLAALAPQCQLVALGGATEAAIWSNAIDVPARIPAQWTSIPYGFPLANQCYRVVDTQGRDCPDWVVGELWIGGAGVARGYRGDPERTAERFVAHAGQRWYRTGDYGRYWPDGTLEFLGRRDTQLKIRGNRTELGEVETVLETHPQIGRAVVAVFDKPGTTLAAAVTVRSGPDEKTIVTPKWISALDRVLPAWQRVDRIAAPPGDLGAELVEGLLIYLLSPRCAITAQPQSPEVLASAFGVADGYLPIFRLWLSWLTEREILAAGNGGFSAGPRLPLVAEPERWPRLVEQSIGTALAPVAYRLAERADELAAVLRGDLDAVSLLDDPILSPAALDEVISPAAAALSEITDSLNDLIRSIDRPLRIVELGAGAGHTAARLLAGLSPDRVDYTVTDPAARLLTQARQRLASQPHRPRFHRLSGDVVPEELHRNFDVVIANNSLHACDQVESGVATAAELLAPYGVLLALERSALSPLTMLTDVWQTSGSSSPDNGRRQWGTPLPDTQEWCRLLSENGFERAQAWYRDGSALIHLRACRVDSGNPINTGEIREWLAERLPEHMVPHRLAVLSRLPLSANAKVDRARIRRLLEHDLESEAAESEPARGEVEEIVAATWSEVLNISTVSRADNFFTLGGDSMLMLKVQNLLARRLGNEVAIVDLYRYPTVTSLAAHLAAVEERAEPKRATANTRRT